MECCAFSKAKCWEANGEVKQVGVARLNWPLVSATLEAGAWMRLRRRALIDSMTGGQLIFFARNLSIPGLHAAEVMCE